MLDWQDWVCQRTNMRYYDSVLEEYSEEEIERLEDEYDEYIPSVTKGDYSPSNPWDAPGMSIHDFI